MDPGSGSRRSPCCGTCSWCTTTYGTRVGKAIGLTAADVSGLAPLATQVLTAEDQARLKKLGNNGDRIDAKAWGKWTASVDDRQATAEEVLKGMPAPVEAPA